MKCTLCRLLPKEHLFKVCRWSTCDCACFVEYLSRRNRKLDVMKYDSPEWLVLGVSELKGIKIPKEYSEYMYALWNLSRGIQFREGYIPSYWKSMKPKKRIFNYLRKVGLRYGKQSYVPWYRQVK